MGAYIGADERFGSGDQDANQCRFEQVICDSSTLESAYREIAELIDEVSREKLYLEEEIRGEMDFEGIVGRSSALRHVLHLVESVAPSDSTVLLLGEAGTGKELIARPSMNAAGARIGLS
jgi:transcriptional regulator with GAF, ATPase, and Fis domain